MGHDDGRPIRHEHINFDMLPGNARTTVRLTNPLPPNDFHFTGSLNGRDTLMLTITADGKLIPGRDLSSDVATQKVAALLVGHYAEAVDARIQALKDTITKLMWENEVASKRLADSISGEPPGDRHDL